MKKIYSYIAFTFIISTYCTFLTYAQGFNYTLTGNPIDITGWTMGSQSSINADAIDLTQPITGQAGYIYYSTPSTLTECSQFTVTFDFRITESSSPTADGIAFWYITNPPSAFTTGGGLGLPSSLNGLVLALDTYNNNGFPNDNPLISLRNYTTSNSYTEGNTIGQIVPDATSQSFITDGNWHTCTLTYYYGTITVAFDGNAPIMSGTTTLSGVTGYFGFSAGTGSLYSRQSIKNVSITGAPIPQAPTVTNVTYCLNDTAAPLTATGANLNWYTTPTGGTPLPNAPTPSTSSPGVDTWYVSQYITGCSIESARAPITVTVNALPQAPTVNYTDEYCTGQTFIPVIVNGQNPLWYDSISGGVATSTSPSMNTSLPGVDTWYVSQTVNGCESIDRTPVTITVHQTPIPDFDSIINYGCNGDTVHFNNNSQFANQYLWKFGDGTSMDTNSNPTHVYINQNIYNVTLYAIAGSCIDSITKPITLIHPLNANFNINPDTICAGNPVYFFNFSNSTVINGNNASYYWDFGDGNFSNLNTPGIHIYNQSGTYTINLTVTDGVPCSSTYSKIVTVDPSAEINLFKSDSIICAGEKIDFHATYSPTGFDSLVWVFGSTNDSITNENYVTRSYSDAGIYNVTVIGHYRTCPQVSASTLVNVNPMPVLNIGNDDSLCYLGAPIILTDSDNINNPNAHWHWSNGDTTPQVTIVHPGEYKASVEINGCVTTDDIKIYKDCYIDIPNSFTPNGDGVNDYFFPRQYMSSSMTVFNMVIYNRWGQKVYETTNNNGRGWDGKFNETDQPVGVYIYIIDAVTKDGRREHYTGNVTLLR